MNKTVLPILLPCLLMLTLPRPAAAVVGWKFPASGTQLNGQQFKSDAGFEIVDWNDDGRPDIYVFDTGSVGMGLAYLNTGTRTAPRFGHGVGHPFNSTETTPITIEHVQARAYGDLNHDGLTDVIFFDGQLRFCPDTGTPHAPFHWTLWKAPHYFPGSDRMIAENSRYSTGPESMFWNKGIFARQVLTLTVTDWDGDGLQDLLICRTNEEAPGVKGLGVAEDWSVWGRTATKIPAAAGSPTVNPQFLGKLPQPPARGLHFYRNVGTKTEPFFDAGVELRTPEGQPIAAPNPVVLDVDGDGVPDVVSTETEYSCNAFRVDWPTNPSVVWFRRVGTTLQAGRPLVDAAGKPIPAGTMVRFADFRGVGVKDLFVMDGGRQGTIRWYRNAAANAQSPARFEAPVVLRGEDFIRFGFMAQPVVVNWFGPNSRDLILHGVIDPHCKWGLRRTALYRNVGEMRFELVGWFNYNGDEALVPVTTEERQYDVYGSSLSVYPNDGTPPQFLVMSVGGRLYYFSDLAKDGLTFRKMKRIEIPFETNRRRGWQDIPVDWPDKIKAIRINNDPNGLGNLRDQLLHVLQFEAYAGGQNIATSNRVTVTTPDSPKVRVQRPGNMFVPGNANTATELKATSWGGYLGAADITFAEPVKLERIRFLLSDRDSLWYRGLVPFYWQGKLLRMGMEESELWHHYKVDVSLDGTTWTNLVNRGRNEMLYSHPYLIDWDKDGRCDLLLGVTAANGIYPDTKQFRLYRNTGTNADPRFDTHIFAADKRERPWTRPAYWLIPYAAHCGVVAYDFNGDGHLDLMAEAFRDGELDLYLNVAPEGNGFTFERLGPVRTDTGPFQPGGGYRFFDLADLDGDGGPDVIHCSGGDPIIFRGVPATAPAHVTDLAVTAVKPGTITVEWTCPTNAATYDVRWTTAAFSTELDWPRHASVTGAYTTARQIVELTSLPAGQELTIAVKSANTNQQVSGISTPLKARTLPLRQIVLRNGPAVGTDRPAYAQCVAVTLDAKKPSATATNFAEVEVRAQTPHERSQKITLVRFAGLPTGAVQRATLELAAKTGNVSPLSCNAIAGDWEPVKATWTQTGTGRNWEPKELDTGGRFQSFAESAYPSQPLPWLAWDVTRAVQAAQQSGGDSVSFLLRVDYTGHYVAANGNKFSGPADELVEHRPRLRLVTVP